MVRDSYQYAIELERKDHSTLGQFPVTMDWEPAAEWARFMALRVSRGASKLRHGGASVEPDWDRSLGEPHVGGVRVSLEGNGSASSPVILPKAYFNRAAVEASKDLVAKKLLEPGEKFLYSVVAFRAARKEPPRIGLALTVEEIASPFAVKSGDARHLLGNATAFGKTELEDVPVFLPQRILDQAGALTRAAAADETAGILLGHVCRDQHSGDLFLEATDLIPAKHARSESTRVTFTADTWMAVDGAIRLRREGELMIGWFHSHPAKYWCSLKCSPEARRSCPLSRAFFSGEDCALHRAVFPMAYCVALLVTHAESGLRPALFGWRQGLIAQRGFHVLNAAPEIREAESSEAIIGGNHEEICT